MLYYVNVVYRDSFTYPPVFTYSGNMVNSVSINLRDDNINSYYAFAQNTNNSNWQNFAKSGSSTITLNTTGRYIQLSNGSSSVNMYASAYYPASSPYYFRPNPIGGLLKSSSEEDSYGRGVALETDELGFSYSMKSLRVDKSNIKFVEIPEIKDTTAKRRGMQYLSLDSLNTMLLSEPFTIQKGTTISFSEGGGFIASAEQQSGKNYHVDCTIELMEEGTNKLIGVVKQSHFTTADSKDKTDITVSNLQISSNDTKNVRLKVTLTSNIPDVRGIFVNEYNTVNNNALSKLATEELTLKEEGVIKTYALEQNYPNPFNPTTTINYQIPKDGFVTLKIYDVLGREVAVLVNENKSTGRYNINFNASNLASGVYMYQIKVNDFVSTKKLLLLK